MKIVRRNRVGEAKISTLWSDWYYFSDSPENCMVITYGKSMDQLGRVANSARSQLSRENCFFPVRVRA